MRCQVCLGNNDDNGVETKILYECDMTRERGLMVNNYKNEDFYVCVPLEAPWLCTIWAAQQSPQSLLFLHSTMYFHHSVCRNQTIHGG